MTKEWLEATIKTHHQDMIDKGFYDCPACEGKGFHNVGSGIHTYESECKTCKGSKIDPNKNIGELLMLIVSELGEALEAHRCGKFADWEKYEHGTKEWGLTKVAKWSLDDLKIMSFKSYIKDTFEDEIADVILRLFDLYGYLKRYFGLSKEQWFFEKGNVAEELLTMTQFICTENLTCSLNYIIQFCEYHKIPIQKHIEAKRAYNKKRPHKHGKEY